MQARRVTVSETRTEMTWIVMPGQANALGTVFGGQIMAWVDVCAAVSAQRFARGPVVTAAMDSLSFLAPIQKGQIVVVRSQVNWAGRTSMEVGARVECENPLTGELTHTSSAYLTFVALGPRGKPVAVPELLTLDPEEQRRFREAVSRRESRLEAKARLLAARSES